MLRSIGLTKAEGQRIFMYEAVFVVTSAALSGIIIGVLTIIMVTVQFYLFIELNWVIEFPTWLLISMIVVSMVTTIFSVYIPMKKVNERPIAVALKAIGT